MMMIAIGILLIVITNDCDDNHDIEYYEYNYVDDNDPEHFIDGYTDIHDDDNTRN